MQGQHWSAFLGGWWRRRLIVAGLAAVACFAVLAGRFWHPYYGFTRWLQLDELDAQIAVRELRESPVFVYPGANGYDGTAYVQVAFHPLLDSPELQPAIGNVPYRARRILLSAFAWLLAAGNPAHVANLYAGLNLAVWLALAALLWRILPVNDSRSLLAWVGVMFSAGALHSVRLALTDLLGAALVVAAIALAERSRARGGVLALAAAGLARETALAAVTGLWRGPWVNRPAWLRNAIRTVLVALPLFAWVLYIRWRVGPADQGMGNFSLPLEGWLLKWPEIFSVYVTEPHFRWLNTTTLLATIALTVQAVWLARRLEWDDPWWRVGASGVVLLAVLGTSVWEGQPGAATRVLLPMSVAFAVAAVRQGASAGWIAAGSLTVFSGVLALWHVPEDPRELAAGRFERGAYVVRVAGETSGVERDGGRAWAWSAQQGAVSIESVPRGSGAVEVALRLRAIAPREVEVRAGGAVLWRGPVAERSAWVSFPARLDERGRLELELRSDAEPVRESADPTARALGFAVSGVRMR